MSKAVYSSPSLLTGQGPGQWIQAGWSCNLCSPITSCQHPLCEDDFLSVLMNCACKQQIIWFLRWEDNQPEFISNAVTGTQTFPGGHRWTGWLIWTGERSLVIGQLCTNKFPEHRAEKGGVNDGVAQSEKRDRGNAVNDEKGKCNSGRLQRKEKKRDEFH